MTTAAEGGHGHDAGAAMRYYPVFLSLEGRPCVVLGGGRVAERKARALLSAGALVTVISPRATAGLLKLRAAGSIRLIRRRYRAGDLPGHVLAVAAAGEPEANRAASVEAMRLGIPVNVVDEPALSSFIAPATVDRGSLVIAISTSGESPYLARALREDIERAYGREYSAFVEILGAVRRKLMWRPEGVSAVSRAALAGPLSRRPSAGQTREAGMGRPEGASGASSGKGAGPASTQPRAEQTREAGLKKGAKYDKKERIMKALVHSDIPFLLRRGDLEGVSLYLEGLLGKGYNLVGLGLMKGRAFKPLSEGPPRAWGTKKSR